MTDFGKRTGDMSKSVYDADADGTVDDSEKLEASTKSQVQDHTPKAHTHTESEISDLDHNALKVKGVVINDAAKADQKVLAYDSGSDRIVYISQAPSGAVINTIQRGIIELDAVISNTQTITSVDTSKAICIGAGFLCLADQPRGNFHCLKLISATSVEASRNAPDYKTYAAYQIIEFSSGVASSQRGEFNILLDDLSADFTISQVDPTKCILAHNGTKGSIVGNAKKISTTLELINSTTIRATRGVVDQPITQYFDLIEFE